MSQSHCLKCGEAFTLRDVICESDEGEYVHLSHYKDNPDRPPLGFLQGLSTQSVNEVLEKLQPDVEEVQRELDELTNAQQCSSKPARSARSTGRSVLTMQNAKAGHSTQFCGSLGIVEIGRGHGKDSQQTQSYRRTR